MKKIEKVVSDADFSKMKKVENNHNKYVDKSFNFYFSFQLRIILMIIIILALGTISYFCFKTSFSNTNKHVLLISKKANVTSDIKVKNNESLTDSGDGNEIYLSDVIDELTANLEYEYDGNLKGKYSYDIDTKATMLLKDENNNTVSENKKTISDVKTVTVDESEVSAFTIKEPIKIDYNSFNTSAIDIKNTYNLNITGNIILTTTIKVYGNINGFKDKIIDTQIINITIPLLSNNVDAKIKDTDLSNKKYTNTDKPKIIHNYILDLGIVLLIVAVIILLILLRFLYNIKPKKSKYCTLRDGILKDYDEIIVNSRKVPKIEKYNIIDCYSFSELLDAQRMVDKPIVYYEIVRDQKCMFVLIGENDIYKYTLKECDIDY